MTKKVAIAYIPVLHKGYYDFLTRLEISGVQELYLIGDNILEAHEELDYLNRKDRLRAVPVSTIIQALLATTSLQVAELTKDQIVCVQEKEFELVTPREDIGEVVVQHYFSEHTVEYVDVYVRRNKLNVGEEKVPDTTLVSISEFQENIWRAVFAEAAKSADWWRQVGAALVKDDEVVYVTHNKHMPEEQTPNIEGDARSLFKKGIHINYVTAAHAEIVALGTAAKEGIVTKGAEMYVTDFPCPYCARMIVAAGIAKVYFVKGYAVLDGDALLKEAGVEVVQVKI